MNIHLYIHLKMALKIFIGGRRPDFGLLVLLHFITAPLIKIGANGHESLLWSNGPHPMTPIRVLPQSEKAHTAIHCNFWVFHPDNQIGYSGLNPLS
jgi:hypothetical protein